MNVSLQSPHRGDGVLGWIDLATAAIAPERWPFLPTLGDHASSASSPPAPSGASRTSRMDAVSSSLSHSFGLRFAGAAAACASSSTSGPKPVSPPGAPGLPEPRLT